MPTRLLVQGAVWQCCKFFVETVQLVLLCHFCDIFLFSLHCSLLISTLSFSFHSTLSIYSPTPSDFLKTPQSSIHSTLNPHSQTQHATNISVISLLLSLTGENSINLSLSLSHQLTLHSSVLCSSLVLPLFLLPQPKPFRQSLHDSVFVIFLCSKFFSFSSMFSDLAFFQCVGPCLCNKIFKLQVLYSSLVLCIYILYIIFV